MNRYILLTIKKTFLFIVMSALFSSCIVDPVERQEVGFRSGKTAFSYVEELLNFYLENLNRMMILEDYLNNPSDNTD